MGQAPTPVVFLHSAGLTPQMWQSQVEAVATLLQPDDGTDVRAIAPWLAGLRPGRPGELSLNLAAAEVVSTLDRYGMESARLVGHQLGAMVALEVASAEPERVAALVLSGAFATPGKVALALQKSLIRVMPNRALADSGATKEDLVRALDLMATADFGSHLKDITVPVLIVAGAADPGLPAARQLASQLPNARLEELAGAAANPSLEAPDAYNRLLVDFLS
ncbi:MAG: alpha/beta hydrolase [Propionicimonas sp.]|uniref:alpha/beta fold hydrolase n=1 Tax=Propionicimonas sp. TaxID=1955623 RepID=UPI003D0D36B1